MTLIVCYVINYSPTLPKIDIFPYDDLLLPPESPASPVAEADLDVESGDQLRQRRHGKGPRYHNMMSDEPGVLFDSGDAEEEAPSRCECLLVPNYGQLTLASSRSPLLASAPIRRGRSGVPLVFNIPLRHMLSLILRLPGPSPMRVASGGTPYTTPPATPQVSQDDMVRMILNAAVAQDQTQRGPQPTTAATDTTSEASSTEPRPAGSRDGQRSVETDEEDPGRIPGDYWTSRAAR